MLAPRSKLFFELIAVTFDISSWGKYQTVENPLYSQILNRYLLSMPLSMCIEYRNELSIHEETKAAATSIVRFVDGAKGASTGGDDRRSGDDCT